MSDTVRASGGTRNHTKGGLRTGSGGRGAVGGERGGRGPARLGSPPRPRRPQRRRGWLFSESLARMEARHVLEGLESPLKSRPGVSDSSPSTVAASSGGRRRRTRAGGGDAALAKLPPPRGEGNTPPGVCHMERAADGNPRDSQAGGIGRRDVAWYSFTRWPPAVLARRSTATSLRNIREFFASFAQDTLDKNDVPAPRARRPPARVSWGGFGRIATGAAVGTLARRVRAPT